jgi:hypothetical protein
MNQTTASRRNTYKSPLNDYGLMVTSLGWAVPYAELPSTDHPRRLHLENVAHLYSYLLSNDFKQRKAFLAADSAQQARRISSMHFGLVQLYQENYNAECIYSKLDSSSYERSIDKRFTGKIGPSRRATKTLDSMTATALRSERVNPTTKPRSLDSVNAVPSHMLLLTGVLCKEALARE